MNRPSYFDLLQMREVMRADLRHAERGSEQETELRDMLAIAERAIRDHETNKGEQPQ